MEIKSLRNLRTGSNKDGLEKIVGKMSLVSTVTAIFTASCIGREISKYQVVDKCRVKGSSTNLKQNILATL